MQQDALTKLSYGVYIIGTKDVDQNRFCGMASDAIMQVSIEPPMLAVSFMNNGYTKRQIDKTGRFSVSVLGENVDPAVIECFGYNSSKNIDKWSKVSCQVRSDLPYYGDSVSDLELKVVGEHRFENYTVFFANVVDSWDKKDEKPLTYVDYQTRLKNDVLKIFQNKRGVNKMENKEVWVCVVCGYVYDGDVPFEELPDTWTCPLCGVGKDMFEKRTV